MQITRYQSYCCFLSFFCQNRQKRGASYAQLIVVIAVWERERRLPTIPGYRFFCNAAIRSDILFTILTTLRASLAGNGLSSL